VVEPPGVVTVTLTCPGELAAGAVMLMVVPVLAMMVDALMPKVTEALDKFVPVILTLLPAVNGPEPGEMLMMVGAAT